MSEPEKKAEQAPQSFVDPKDFEQKKEKEQVISTIKIDGKEVHILKPDIALTLILGRLVDINNELKMLNAVFSKAAEPKNFQTVTPPPQQAQSMAPLQAPLPPTEQTPRIKEILAALEPVKDLLKIDLESSAMFVMVKPAGFLGQENFAKVAQIIRSIGGQYVSAAKNSHFEISKAPMKK